MGCLVINFTLPDLERLVQEAGQQAMRLALGKAVRVRTINADWEAASAQRHQAAWPRFLVEPGL